MEARGLDSVARWLGRAGSRRGLLFGVALGPLADFIARPADDVRARKKRKSKRKTKRRKPNAYGCLNVGQRCKKARQCCSGVCRGRKGKRRCAAHDAGVCTVDVDYCAAGQAARCGFSNANCTCVVTTGNAAFCGDFSGPPGVFHCQSCSHDTDCEADFGLGAACVVYGEVCESFCPETGGTACLPPCNDTDE